MMTLVLLIALGYLGIGVLVMLPIRMFGIPTGHKRKGCDTCSPPCYSHKYPLPVQNCTEHRVVSLEKCHHRWIGNKPLKLSEWLFGACAWPIAVVALILTGLYVTLYVTLTFVATRVDRVMSIRV